MLGRGRCRWVAGKHLLCKRENTGKSLAPHTEAVHGTTGTYAGQGRAGRVGQLLGLACHQPNSRFSADCVSGVTETELATYAPYVHTTHAARK